MADNVRKPTPTIEEMRAAMTASWRVTGRACKISPVVGNRAFQLMPKSSRAKPERKSAYWTQIGRSRPKKARSDFSTSSVVSPCARMVSTKSPGTRRMIRNTRVTTPKRVEIIERIRVAIYLAIRPCLTKIPGAAHRGGTATLSHHGELHLEGSEEATPSRSPPPP